MTSEQDANLGFEAVTNHTSNDDVMERDSDFAPVPQIITSLWPHQEASVSKVVEG